MFVTPLERFNSDVQAGEQQIASQIVFSVQIALELRNGLPLVGGQAAGRLEEGGRQAVGICERYENIVNGWVQFFEASL